MQKLCDQFPEVRNGERLKTYNFLHFALFDYYKCRRQQDRTAETVKNADQIAGITFKKLNQEQAVQGINKRLLKGVGLGEQAKEMLAALDLFGESSPFNIPEEGAEKRPITDQKKRRPQKNLTRDSKKENSQPKTPDRILKISDTKSDKELNSKLITPEAIKASKEKASQFKEMDKNFRAFVREKMETTITNLINVFIDMEESEGKIEMIQKFWLKIQFTKSKTSRT